MENKEIMVKCSFCNKEVPCPESMATQKHACFECFTNLKDKLNPKDIDRIHVAIPKDKLKEAMPDMLTNHAMQKIFPEFWSENKTKFKEMSDKQIAEESFLAGASIMLSLKEDFEREIARKE